MESEGKTHVSPGKQKVSLGEVTVDSRQGRSFKYVVKNELSGERRA